MLRFSAQGCTIAIQTSIEGGVGIVRLDRPERAHAYDREHLAALDAGFSALAGQVPVVVVCSTGERAFCAGADLGAMEQASPLDALDLFSQEVFGRIAASSAVSVCAIQGAAVAGGFELALACDLRVVGPRARLSLPETGLGIIPSAGGCTRLTRCVGPARARQVILAGHVVDAAQAVDWGLALCVADNPLAEATAVAERLLERDPVAMAFAKQVIDVTESRQGLFAERAREALLYARKRGR